MNQTFLAAVKQYGGPGTTIRTAAGTIPAHVNPPAEPSAGATGSTTMSLASSESRPAASRTGVQVASAEASGGIGGFFSNLFGSKGEESQSVQESAPRSKPAAPAASATPASKPVQAASARPRTEPPRSVDAKTAGVQSSPLRQEASAEPPGKPAAAASLLTGAAPTMPSGGFENRFGAWR